MLCLRTYSSLSSFFFCPLVRLLRPTDSLLMASSFFPVLLRRDRARASRVVACQTLPLVQCDAQPHRYEALKARIIGTPSSHAPGHSYRLTS